MSDNKIRALFIPVGKLAEVVEFDDALNGFQEKIGGYIERAVHFHSSNGRRFDVWCDEEGRLKKLPPNRLVPSVGLICGPILITAGQDGDADTYSLTDREIELLSRATCTWPFALTQPPPAAPSRGDA